MGVIEKNPLAQPDAGAGLDRDCLVGDQRNPIVVARAGDERTVGRPPVDGLDVPTIEE
jgi:hypothetical protein